MKKTVNIIPAILPGEAVISHVMRMSILTGARGLKPFAKQLFNLTALQPPLLFPSNLASYVEQTAPALRSVDVAIFDHTLFRAVAPFLDESQRNFVFANMKNGGKVKSVFSFTGLVHKRAGDRAVLKFCPICAIESQRNFGLAYWHVEHQFPGVRTCGIHGVSLSAGCGRCEFSTSMTRIARLPDTVCWCGNSNQPLSPFQAEEAKGADVRISRIIHEALLLSPPVLSPFQRCDFYRASFRQLGFGKGIFMGNPAIEEVLVQHFGEELLDAYGSFGKLRLNWLAKALRKEAPIRSPLKHYLLVDFLFGSWKNYCNESRKFLSTSDNSLEKRSSKLPSLPTEKGWRKNFRNQITNLIRANPDLTRSFARSQMTRVFDCLYAHDRDWLNVHLPARPNAAFKGLKSRAIYLRDFGDAAVSHIQTRFKQLNNFSTRPVRITRSALLVNGPRRRELVSEIFPYARVEALLESLVETKLSYQIRLCKWIFLNPAVVPDFLSPLQFASKTSGLPQKRIQEYLEGAGETVMGEVQTYLSSEIRSDSAFQESNQVGKGDVDY